MKKKTALFMAMALTATAVMPTTMAAAAEEGVTITFFDKNSGSKAFDDRIAQEIMNRTGVKVEVQNPTGNPGEKLSLMLAGKDYPDIVLMDRSSDIVAKYIDAGALVCLSDYWDQLPNVVEMYGETLQKTRYKDGNNYYLSNWYGYDPDPVNGFIMKYDYMVDIVGQERADSHEPFTQEEFAEILKQFKEKYPEINGKTSYGLTVNGNTKFEGMFGIKDYYIDDEGQLHWKVYDPQYLNMLYFENDLYTQGLLDVEWVMNQDNSELLTQKLTAGNMMGVAAAYWDVSDANLSIRTGEEGQTGQYVAYKVLGDGIAEDGTSYGGRSSLGWDAIAITNNCENLDAALKLVDFCASQEGQDLMLWGIEGEDYTKDGDNYIPNPDVVDQLTNDPNGVEDTGITRWTWFVKNEGHSDGTTSRIQYNEKDWVTQFAWDNLTDTYYDSAEYSALEPAASSIEGLKYQKCQDIMDQAYPKMVNASGREEVEQLYNQMLSDLEAAGLADVEKVMNEKYQERLELWGMK